MYSNATSLHVSRRKTNAQTHTQRHTDTQTHTDTHTQRHTQKNQQYFLDFIIILDRSSPLHITIWPGKIVFADQVGGQDHQQVAGGWRVAHRR